MKALAVKNPFENAFAAGALALLALLAQAPARAQLIQGVTEVTPYTFLQGGRVAGPATEIVEATLQRAGLDDYRIGMYPWARAYDLALKEPNVLIYLIARTPTREAQFKWVGEFMRIEYFFYKLRARTDVAVNQPDDARAHVIGVTRDDVRHQHLQAKGYTKLVVSGQNSDNFSKLLNGQVQLLVLPENDAVVLCQDAHFSCDGLQRLAPLDSLSTPLYMAFSVATPDATVDRARRAFETVKAEGGLRKMAATRR